MSTSEKATTPGLERALGLKEAVALNMIEIVGIGPFVVSSLVIRAMGGPQALLAWLGGALLAALDGFVWSELGAAMPKAGGTYVFLREAYGPEKWGRLMSFLFVWQTFLHVPLSVASASIGFASYAKYLYPFSTLEAKAISGGLVLLLIVLLYRRIGTIGKISVFLWIGVVGVMLWLIWGGLRHFNAKLAFDFPEGAFAFSSLWFAGLGSAMILWVALASIFSVLLGASRVPYSAALDDNFFPVFARLHPTKHFPYVSLLVLGGLASLFSVILSLQSAIVGILAVRLMVQFVGQAVGVMLLRRRWSLGRFPCKMWLYPLPAVLSMTGWFWLFWRTGPARKWGLLQIALGVVAFLIWTWEKKQWPFARAVTGDSQSP